jgi:hypothetical protein
MTGRAGLPQQLECGKRQICRERIGSAELPDHSSGSGELTLSEHACAATL